MKRWERISIIVLSMLLLIITVSAEGTSIILDNDKTTEISGNVLVFCSVIIFIFAAIIIIKILTMRGEQ
jgi:hypothetical protein